MLKLEAISSISTKARLTKQTNLIWLELDNNKITDVTPLAGLANLRVLDLSNNQIKDVSPLTRLINQDELNIRNNQITNVSPPSGLTRLTQLNDEETRRIILKVVGRENEGWLNEDSIMKLPCTDLRTVDQVWVETHKGALALVCKSVFMRKSEETGKKWAIVSVGV